MSAATGAVIMMPTLTCGCLCNAAGACLPSCGVLPELPHHQPLPVAPIHGASYQRPFMLTAPPHSVHDVRQRCVSAAGLLSAPAGGQHCAGCRVLCWSPGMSWCSQEAGCPVPCPQRLKHISGCWLQVARHTGNTIAFHMKNYGNFTQVGRHATQLTPAHAAMCIVTQATVLSSACMQHAPFLCLSKPRCTAHELSSIHRECMHMCWPVPVQPSRVCTCSK